MMASTGQQNVSVGEAGAPRTMSGGLGALISAATGSHLHPAASSSALNNDIKADCNRNFGEEKASTDRPEVEETFKTPYVASSNATPWMEWNSSAAWHTIQVCLRYTIIFYGVPSQYQFRLVSNWTCLCCAC